MPVDLLLSSSFICMKRLSVVTTTLSLPLENVKLRGVKEVAWGHKVPGFQPPQASLQLRYSLSHSQEEVISTNYDTAPLPAAVSGVPLSLDPWKSCSESPPQHFVNSNSDVMINLLKPSHHLYTRFHDR